MKRFFLTSLIAFTIGIGCLNADTFGQKQVTAPNHTTNGYVKQGCFGLAFLCGTGATCTVQGATIPANILITIPINAGATAGDVQYTVSGGTLWSIEVR